MKKLAVLFCAAVLAVAGCGSGTGSNKAKSPAPADTCGGYSRCTASAPAQGGAPVPFATADAGPLPKQTSESSGGNDCNFYYHPNATGLEADVDLLHIIGTVHVTCNPLPRSLSVALTIYRLPPFSKHYAAVGVGGSTFPGKALTEPTLAIMPCEPGILYLEMYAVGVSASGNHFTAHVIGADASVPQGICM